MIEVHSPISEHAFSNLEEFVAYLRRFNQNSFLNIGLPVMWNMKKEEDLLDDIRSRVILLALASTNVHRRLMLTNSKDIEFLCKDYANIEDPHIDSSELIKAISTLKNKDELIPDSFLDNLAPIQEALSSNRVLRTHNLSIQKSQVSHLLLTSWKLFSAYNAACKNDPSKKEQPLPEDTIKNSLNNMTPLRFYRACLWLFDCASKKNGYIDIDITKYSDTNLKDGLEKDVITLLRTTEFSIAQSDLRKKFLERVVYNFPPGEQKYFPNPLAKDYPLIHMNGSKPQKFVMISPQHFVYAAANYLFLELQKVDRAFNKKFGDFIEDHIKGRLESIFRNCEKIVATQRQKGMLNKNADFKIELPNCILIIDVKKNIAPFYERSIMGVRNIAKMWGGLYSVCQQLSASCEDVRKNNPEKKTIIPIVLFWDPLNFQHASFQLFAKQSGLLQSLGITLLEIFSWPHLESILSQTSVEKFKAALLNRQTNASSMSVEDVLIFKPDSDDKLTHSYEYLKECREEVTAKNNAA